MLSKNQVVKVRKAIEKMYDGVCTVTVQHEYEKNNGATGFEPVVTVENEACHLSYSSISSTSTGEVASSVEQVIKLFIAPEIEIPSGSKITVTQAGIATDYTQSGIPARYDTHQEIVLKLFEGWS